MSQSKTPPPPQQWRTLPSPLRSMRYNWQTFRDNPLGEIAGSLGDLGTLLPLLTAMAATGSIDPTATFIFSGLWNIVSGGIFGIPIVVQPMKAIAGISVSRPMTLHETMGAGISVSIIVLILSITGLLSTFGRIIPTPLVKGIQMGAGLSLVLNAGAQLLKMSWTSGKSSPADNYIVIIVLWVILCVTARYKRFPYALILFLIGILLTLLSPTSPHIPLSPGLNVPKFTPPSWSSIQSGFWLAGLGQLPLTSLNSIIAVTYLSEELFPTLPPPSITSLGVSVASMNLIGCWFGAMPVCHGSGGLSGQVRFGAQSGASVIFLGLVKLVVGLVFGSTISSLLVLFPKSFLTVMVFAAGVELAKVGEGLNSTARDLWEVRVAHDEDDEDDIDEGRGGEGRRWERRVVSEREGKERFTVMLVTLGGVIAARNDAVGLLAGTVCYLGYRFQDYVEQNEGYSNYYWSWNWRFWESAHATESDPLLAH